MRASDELTPATSDATPSLLYSLRVRREQSELLLAMRISEFGKTIHPTNRKRDCISNRAEQAAEYETQSDRDLPARHDDMPRNIQIMDPAKHPLIDGTVHTLNDSQTISGNTDRLIKKLDAWNQKREILNDTRFGEASRG